MFIDIVVSALLFVGVFSVMFSSDLDGPWSRATQVGMSLLIAGFTLEFSSILY